MNVFSKFIKWLNKPLPHKFKIEPLASGRWALLYLKHFSGHKSYITIANVDTKDDAKKMIENLTREAEYVEVEA